MTELTFFFMKNGPNPFWKGALHFIKESKHDTIFTRKYTGFTQIM